MCKTYLILTATCLINHFIWVVVEIGLAVTGIMESRQLFIIGSFLMTVDTLTSFLSEATIVIIL